MENDKYIRKVTWVGLIANLFLAALKFVAGVWGGSQVVVADAIHSLTDSITDIAVIAGSYFWTKPPDGDHPHGHHRIETFVTVFIGVVLLVAGVGIGWQAIITIPEEDMGPPGWIAAFAAAVSIIFKEALYRWTALAGKRVKSSALAANAWHHRLDAISSVPTLIAVSVIIFFPQWSILDHVGAVIVSILIMQAALRIIWPRIREFMDTAAPKEVYEKIRLISLEHSDVKQVHKIRTRYLGMNVQVDMHLVVDSTISVFEGHRIAAEVKRKIMSEDIGVVDVLIHVEPMESILPTIEF